MTGVSWRADPLWIRQSTALAGSFPSYAFSQIISCPSLGADGAGRACKEARWPYEMVNGIDIKGGLEACLRQLHGEDHKGIMIQDVCQVTFATLPSSDGFIGTSPCGDFSVLGANDKIGLEGERGGLFQQQLEFIRHLAGRREPWNRGTKRHYAAVARAPAESHAKVGPEKLGAEGP